jgi:hypothetical protein
VHALVFPLEAACCLSDIYFEVDNEDALLESIMGEDKIAVTALFIQFPPSPVPSLHEFVSLMSRPVHVVGSWMQHVIIGLDNTQVFADLDLAAASATDFAQEDDDDDEDDDGSEDDEESDFDDDFNDVVKIILKLLTLPVRTLEGLMINLHV